MFKTRITRLLGIDYPIIQGGMLWLSRAELVSAVSNAGGLGILSSATFPTREEFQKEIRRVKSLTSKPFGVNIPLFPAIKPLDIEGYVRVMAEEEVSILETAGRNPLEYMALFRRFKMTVMHKVTAVRFARKAQEIGCDAVVVDGFECGGHPGEEDVSSTVLLPAAVDAVDIPVVAAGGFADGRGLVAALALGAEGVLMGTRFMLSREAPMSQALKDYLITLKETDTMFVLRSLRNTARVINNAAAQRVAALEREGATIEDLIPLVAGIREREVMETGDISRGLLHCGQVVGLIGDVPSAGDIIKNMMAEGERIIKGLCSGEGVNAQG